MSAYDCRFCVDEDHLCDHHYVMSEVRRGVHPVVICDAARMSVRQLQRHICGYAMVNPPSSRSLRGSIVRWRSTFARLGHLGLG